jgi:hypothetical protein
MTVIFAGLGGVSLCTSVGVIDRRTINIVRMASLFPGISIFSG